MKYELDIDEFLKTASLYMDKINYESSLEHEDGTVSPNHLVSFAATYYGTYKVALSPSDIDKIYAFYNDVFSRNMIDKVDLINYIVDMCTTRMKNHLLLHKKTIISLGENCLPRTIPTKWGLKLPRALGEVTMPFDLAVHSKNAIVNNLKHRFAEYIPYNSQNIHNGPGYPVDNSQGIHWNHETGVDWATNDYEKLRNLYHRRAENLINSLSKSNLCIFFSEGVPDSDYEQRICEVILENYNKNNESSVFFLYTGGECISDNDKRFSEIKSRSVCLPKPYKHYEWWNHAHFATDLGHKWERDIVAIITEMLIE